MSWLSKWKLFDNLRRSLVPFALTILFLSCWIFLPEALIWTLSAAGIILIPPIIISILDMLQKTPDMQFSQHFAFVLRSTGMNLAQAVFTLLSLPYEAFSNLNSIIKTLWRMLISHKRLLEWNPFNSAGRKSRFTLMGSYITMWISPFISISSIMFFEFSKRTVPISAIPILLLWTVSPAITWWISLPLVRRKANLTISQKIFLRNLSRKIWSFFETFVGPEDHWLPPDNFQENPAGVIAHRTSPTNIGLALLANLSAYDFGYISAGQFIQRTSDTFKTMETLGRYQGHFCNWYDTQTLMPLRPFYISTVDSGNLAAHLLTSPPGYSYTSGSKNCCSPII